jgi:hypothetical protein
MKYLFKMSLTYAKNFINQKMHGAKLRARLKNACFSLMRRLNQYFDDSEKVFGALAEFPKSPIKPYFCMNAIILECCLLTYIIL